jgi:hypothetical protein
MYARLMVLRLEMPGYNECNGNEWGIIKRNILLQTNDEGVNIYYESRAVYAGSRAIVNFDFERRHPSCMVYQAYLK